MLEKEPAHWHKGPGPPTSPSQSVTPQSLSVAVGLVSHGVNDNDNPKQFPQVSIMLAYIYMETVQVSIRYYHMSVLLYIFINALDSSWTLVTWLSLNLNITQILILTNHCVTIATASCDPWPLRKFQRKMFENKVYPHADQKNCDCTVYCFTELCGTAINRQLDPPTMLLPSLQLNSQNTSMNITCLDLDLDIYRTEQSESWMKHLVYILVSRDAQF